jgi:hypothetical protein
LLDELKKVDKLSDKDLAAIAVDKNKIFIIWLCTSCRTGTVWFGIDSWSDWKS